MVMITEVSDDKNVQERGLPPQEPPQEEENLTVELVENPQDGVLPPQEPREVEANQIRYLPVEMLEMIFTRMRRADHPQVSLIAKFCRGLIISPEFCRSRLELGLSESIVYTFIRYRRLHIRPTWGLLNPKLDSLLLTRVTTIPMLRGSAVVTTDCRMFIVGGYHRKTTRPVSTVFMVDCRTHTHIELPRMKIPRSYAAAGIIDRKLYVVGGSKKRIADFVEMFDFEQNRWESIDGPQHMALWRGGNTIHSIVLNDVIYAYDLVLCLSYSPRNRRTWNSWYSEDSIFCSLWRDPYCVCEGRLFVVDEACVSSDRVKFFNSEQNQWIPVRGIEMPKLRYQGSKMTYLGGGKLLILATDNNRLWSIRVELQSDEKGVLSGRVESASLVVTYIKDSPPTIDHCLSLTY